MNAWRRKVLAIALGVMIPMGLVGCSAGRTPESFCKVMDTHRVRYETAMAQATINVEQGDVLGMVGGLAQTVSALGDLQIMWNELADVSPDEIREDIIAVRDTNQQQLEQVKNMASDPLGALTGILAGGLATSGSFQRVNDYALEHCGAAPYVNEPAKP